MNPSVKWANASLIFLLIALSIGVLLRLSFSVDIPFIHFANVKHAHSHVVLLGWAFNAVWALLLTHYHSELNSTLVNRIFWILQFAVLGMMIAFPIQGYALYSIIFSTLHIFGSYVLVGHFLIKMRHDHSDTTRWVKAALWLYVLSTFGPYALGPLSVNGMQDTPYYSLAIFFYLHFFYNGFFTIAILSLINKVVFTNNKDRNVRTGMRLILWSVVPTYSLSMYCFYTWDWLYMVGLVSSLTQLGGFLLLLKGYAKGMSKIDNKYVRYFLWLGIISLGGKMVLQLLSSLPILTEHICQSHAFIIAYLHLVFIGFITISLIGLLIHQRLIVPIQRLLPMAFALLLVGFVCSQLLIIYPPLQAYLGWVLMPNYYNWLAGTSVIILMGALLLVIRRS